MNKYTHIKTIAFDADDTLWVNEPIFTQTHDKCKDVVEKYVDPSILEEKLYETEIKNLQIFGYGIKGFILSIIETAIELSEGKITGNEIQKIIDLGKDMVAHPTELIEGVQETIEKLSPQFDLMMITKGDLFDQESKIARSGLADFFQRIEIVSEKNEESYQMVLDKYGLDIQEVLMVGNSLKSDILPICKLGGKAIHIPFHTTWVHEMLESHQIEGFEYDELSSMRQLPKLLNL